MKTDQMLRRRNIVEQILKALIVFEESRIYLTNEGNIDISGLKRHKLCSISGITDSEFGNNQLRDIFPMYTGIDKGIRIKVKLLISEFPNDNIIRSLIGIIYKRVEGIKHDEIDMPDSYRHFGVTTIATYVPKVKATEATIVWNFINENGLVNTFRNNFDLALKTLIVILKIAANDSESQAKLNLLIKSNPKFVEYCQELAEKASGDQKLMRIFKRDPELISYIIRHKI